MDFIGRLPRSKGIDTTLVVVDHLTKYDVFSLAYPFTVKDMASLFIREMVRLNGFPSSIVSNRDKIFINFKQTGTSLRMMSAYDVGLSPTIDGQIEAVNKCLET